MDERDIWWMARLRDEDHAVLSREVLRDKANPSSAIGSMRGRIVAAKGAVVVDLAVDRHGNAVVFDTEQLHAIRRDLVGIAGCGT